MFGHRKLDRLAWVEFSGVIDTIGEQDQYALILRTLVQSFDRQTHGVTYRGFPPGQAHHRILELLEHRVAIERERCQQICLGAEYDQTDAVATAAVDEIAGDRLDRCVAAYRTSADCHVLGAHAAG